MTTKLFVGNIPETCAPGQLREAFEKYGEVMECDIVSNYGFVHFGDQKEAEMAQQSLHNSLVNGQNIRVELSTSGVRRKPGMGGKSECYRCGKEGHWSSECPDGPPGMRRFRGGPRGGRGRGRGRGGYPGGRDPYDDGYDAPYYRRDRYGYGPPPPDRYRPYSDPYARRGPPPLRPRDTYYDSAYERPPPEYYGRPSAALQRPRYDDYYDMRSMPQDDRRGVF